MKLNKVKSLSGWCFFLLAAFQGIFLVEQIKWGQYTQAATTLIFMVAIVAFYVAVRQSNKAYNELIEAANNMHREQQEAMDMLLRDCTQAQTVIELQRGNKTL